LANCAIADVIWVAIDGEFGGVGGPFLSFPGDAPKSDALPDETGALDSNHPYMVLS
jgi:hypothetical protein